MVTVAMGGALAAHRSPALVAMAIARSRFCEFLAPSLFQPPEQFCLPGILSLPDVLLESPMSHILSALAINAEMKAALAGAESPAGFVPDLVRNLESCDWQRCEDLRERRCLKAGSVAALRCRGPALGFRMAGS
jgi:c-di-GMP-related signal transduction protein